jgi:N12 class adenine-specific DNA methylase
VGTAGVQQPAGVEGAPDTETTVAQPAAPQVAPQAQEAGGQEGEKAKWIKATVDKSRLNGSGGVQLAVAPNGGVTFMGDPNTSKDGKALLANYEKAIAAGATQQEIAAALQAQKASPEDRDRSSVLTGRWNALAQQYKNANEAGKAAIRPEMDRIDAELKQLTRASLMEGNRQIQKTMDDRAAEEGAKAQAMPVGSRLRPSEHAPEKGIYWEKTGPDEWTGRGDWFQNGKTRSSAELASVGGLVAVEAAPAKAPSDVALTDEGKTGGEGPSMQPEWDAAKPVRRRIMLAKAGYTDADQSRVLAGISWARLDGAVRAALNKPAAGQAQPKAKDSDLEKRILFAADSIEKLRKVDVERVLTQGNIDAAEMADYIKRKRPDLAGEADAVLADISADTKPAEAALTPAKGTKPDTSLLPKSESKLIQDFLDGNRDTPPTTEEVGAELQEAMDGEQAWKDLTPSGRLQAMGMVGVKLPSSVYWRNISPENRAKLRPAVREVLAEGKNDELDAEMRAYEAKADAKPPAAPEAATDDDIDAMFDDVLAEVVGDQPAADSSPPAIAGTPAETAVTPEPQPANQEAMAESLEDELRAQKKRVRRLSGGDPLKLKAAEARLRTMRQSIFDAEDKWVPAARNGDQDALAKLEEAGFADTADAIRAFAPAAQRTAGKALKSAAKNAASALDDAINGLGKLFGGSGRLSSGLTFDEETYAKAKPLFISAAANIRAASKDLRDVMREVVNMVVERFGADAAKNMKPYVTQFVKDVRDGKVQLEKEENADAGSAIYGDGATPLGEVASEDDRGAARSGDAQPRGTDGEQGSGATGRNADAGGNAAARGRGNGTAGSDSAESGTGGRGRGRRVASKRTTAPTRQELKEEAAEEIRQASPINIPAVDFTITDEVELGKGTESVKFADNLNAIRTLKKIEQENRRATPEEQRTLARYVGWGGLKNAFRVAGAKDGAGVAKGWEARVAELESLLTPAELRAARNSTTAAHYTSQTVVEAVWKGVERLGFRGGAVLEPSVGTGNFLGLMPANLRGNTRTLAVEYDSLTARIAQQLYPNQSILHSGFQDVPLPDNKFALAIGNPPFGRESLYFRHNPALNGKSIHNQFFMQSIQSVEAGGLMGMVVSHNLMDAQDQSSRLDMAVRAELVGAVRLPDTAFKENARTEVVTDILFFRKRDIVEMNRAVVASRILQADAVKRATILGEFSNDDVARIEAIVAEMQRWVPSSKQENFAGSGETISVNPYFLKNASMVVGTMDASGTMNARADLNVRLEDPSTFADRLNQAIERLPQRDPVDGVAQRTMAQFEQMATGMRLAVARAEPGAVRRTPEGALKVVIEMDDPTQDRKTILSEIELTAQTPFKEAYTLRTDGKWQREEDVLGENGKPLKKLKKDGTPSTHNQKKIVVYESLNEIADGHKWGADRIAALTDMLPVRDALKRQLMLEASDAPPAMIEDSRKRLNAAYENFTKKHGSLHKQSNAKIAMTMPDGALALAVEDVDKDGKTSRAAILSRRVTVPPKPVERVTNAGEAVAVVLAETGGIDIDRVAKLLGTDAEGAAAALSEGDSPRAFFDPETDRWEPADGYLSGLVRRKLMAAKAAGLEKNVAALERVQPEDWDSTQITPNIGSAWIPADVYADFLKHLGFNKSSVTYSPVTNTFSVVTTGSAKAEWVASERALGTSEIVERTLNSKPVKVAHKDSDGKTWVDEEATLESQMKATEIANEFLDWAFADDARRDRLVEVFNEKFNTRVVRQRDGSFLTLPGKVPDEVIKMRPWQLNAIWRGITDSAVLYDHAVGAGKTFTAIARAMERRRMGLSKKPMIVVPNHLVEQWAADVKKLYPGANILAAGKDDFEKSLRRRLFARIGAGDYDMVIVGHSSFGFIDIDPATEERYLDEELRIAYEAVDEAQKAAEEAGFSGWGKPMGVADAERLVKKLEERLAKVRDSKRDRLLTFEEMGVDDLTIDEAHEFKNLAYSSNLQGAAGMGNKAGSAKAMDLNLKLRSLRERPGTSVAFLTGTPISNSVAEMYLVLKNLAPNDLAELGMENFDAWRTTFVSASSAYEPTESGSLKEVTRLGREWMNMKSLMDLYYTIADAVTLQDMKDDFARANPGKSFPVPKVRSQIEGKGDRAMVAIKPSESQRAILHDIVAGFDSLPGISDRKERNSQRLRLMDRARKVSLDARAVSPGLTVPDGEGKIGAVVDNVFATYEKWDADRGTQLVFLDRSVPKTKGDDKIIAAYDKLVADLEKATNKGDEKEIATITEKLEKYSASEIEELRNAQNGGWNAYAEIKRQLVAKGIPANEIRFVQEANTDKQKADLFALVKSGAVRVLIGSTPRMGAGTNVQDRLVALHHVDVTWKPSDIEQREGRIVRQGNALLEKYGDEFAVDVIAYATEMTVDAKMWSLNATKLKAINGIRKYDGSFMMEFDDEESASMAEMAALATGNPLMVERVMLDGDIKKLEMAQRTFNRRMSGIRSQIASAERTIKDGPQWAKTLRDFAQDMERKLAGVNERSDARRVTVNGEQYISAGLAELAAQASIEDQQAQTESGKGRYVVEVNGEKATSRERISALILEAMGDRGFEAEVGGTTVIDLSSAVRAILERRGSGREYTIDGITINGMSVEIDVAPSRWWPDTNSVATVAVLDKDGKPVLVREHSYESPVFSGSSLRAALQKVLGQFDPAYSRADAASQERAVARAERELPDLKAQAEKTFPQLEELNQKRSRLQEVVAALKASSDLARINVESDAEGDVESDVSGAIGQINPLRNADGTFARQDPADDSMAFSATLPRDRNAVRIGITEKGLVRAMRLQFDGLADVTSKLLERGRSGKRGGVIVVSTADNAEIGRIVAERTGRKLDSTMRKFSSAGRLNGFYDPKTGLTFLVAPNLNPVTATAVMLHEMMHGQQRQKIDARALEMVRNRHGLKDEGLRAFLDRVMLRMIAAGEVGNAAEASAYIVEQAVIEGRSAGYTFADNAFMQWVDAKIGKRVGDFLRSFAGMIRTWMLRNGLGAKAMTVDDFVGYAMAGLDRAAGGEVRGRSATVSASQSQARSVGDAPAQEAQRVQSAVEGKTLIEAAQFMTRSKDGAKAAVAQKVLEKLQRLEKAGVVLDLKIVHRGDMAPASMVNSRGYTETGFDEKGRDIVVWLNGADVTGKVGTEEEVLLHELVHAATAGMVFYGTQTPNSLAGKHARDLMAVTDAISEHIRERFAAADAGKATLTEFEQDMRDGANNAFRSDDEVLAWALSNSEAQAYLETIPYRSGSMWSNFVQAVRNLLGLGARNDTALSEVLRVAERILTDDAPAAGRAAFWHKRNIRMAQQQVRGSIVQTAERGDEDLQFSRSGLAGAQEAAKSIGAGLKAITVQDVKKVGRNKLTDWLKLGLQFLGRRQLTDIYGDVLPLADYDRLAAQMEADKNDVGAAADELARRWGKLPDEGKLADLMHDATLAQIDADSAVEYVPGDDLAKSRALKAQFGQLSTEAQKVYREARDHYRKHHAAVRQAIIDRVMRSELREERRAELLKRMDADFFKAIKGAYFPLSRFGQYVVVTKDDAGKVVSVSRAETMAEAEAMRAEMVKAFPARDGYQVGRVILSKEFVAGRDMVGRGFMTELYEALDEQGLDPSVQAELEDTLGQLYLSSLPDLSWAKHGIHRKGTPGFSSDARRAFAQNTFHGARYLAKLKYGDQMQAELDRMQKHVDEMAPIEGFDQPAAQRVVDEMNKRHEATMNPKGNPLSTALTSFGFVYYLGISPAAAVVNLSQTPLVAYPVMGAKWGFRKAGAALMAASAEVVEGKNDLRAVLADRLKNEQDPKAKRKHQDEIAAYDEAVRTGVIDVTMAHDLAGIAQGEDAKVMWKIRPVMRLASYLFHHAERFNRQATFLAAYRLARDAGAKHDTAYSQAVKATYDGHFDYSTGNRPRVMQGNVAKVVLLFKQYAQNMIYTLARNAYQSVKGESPEVRREARKVFGALMTMHAAAAGVLGLPMVGTLLTLASALGGSDDEPWDAEVAMRNMLADTFGAKPAEVIAKGFSRLTPWDISGRVGLDKLLLPDVNESLEGQRWAESFATAMLGPVIGMGVNAAKGAQKMADGDYGRGLEDMLPIFARNPIKAYRQYSEGEVDRTGVVIKDEVSLAGVLGQAPGFSPSEIRLAFEGRSAVMSADRRLNERRQDLMTQFARAAMDQDQGGMAEARAAIADFNKANPGRRITPPQMWQSVRNRERRIREADDGVYLPRTRRDVMAEGRFAEVG